MAASQSVHDRISAIAAHEAGSMGLSLYEVESRFHEGTLAVRISVERDGGSPTIDDCERLAKGFKLAVRLAEPPLPEYTIEVTSVGLTRHIKTIDEMHKNIGRYVVVKLKRPLEESLYRLAGTVQAVEGDSFVLAREDKPEETVAIPFSDTSNVSRDFKF